MKTARSSEQPAKTFKFTALLLKGGWLSPGYVSVDSGGTIVEISGEPPQADIPEQEQVAGYAVPGFQNAHSHAFQYAMAGQTEQHPSGVDDFWTWREAMYAFAQSLNPDAMQSIAAMAYMRMLQSGYTHVVEFHYLHHDKSGKPYGRLSEMSTSLLAAAAQAGIRITLVPVYYNRGGFGRKALPEQARFCFDNTDQYLRLVDECGRVTESIVSAHIGFGVHSLRAADAEDVVRITKEGPQSAPFHMHAAEQVREVEEAVSFLKMRPVEWILENLPVNDRYNLVHCTHVTDDELQHLAQHRVNVIVCPTTEANLGDGIFRLSDFCEWDGQWSIGSDSNVGLDPLEELRWLDYEQRLVTRSRSTFPDGASALVESAFFGGKKAAGLPARDFFEPGQPFDAVVFRDDLPLPDPSRLDSVLPTLVYHLNSSAARGTLVNGSWTVQDQQHVRYEEIYRNFKKSLKDLQHA